MRIPYLLLIVAGLILGVAILAFAFLPNAEAPTGGSIPSDETSTPTADTTPSGNLGIRQPDETTMYNFGSIESTTDKDGSIVNAYTNTQLGLSFSYPETLGEVKVVNNADQILLSLVDPVTNNSTLFMALLKQAPSGRDSYWGDIGYDVTTENVSTFCAHPSSSFAMINAWLKIADCQPLATKDGLNAIEFSGSWSAYLATPIDISVYVFPQNNDLYSAAVISNESFVEQGLELRGVVDGLTFSAPQPNIY